MCVGATNANITTRRRLSENVIFIRMNPKPRPTVRLRFSNRRRVGDSTGNVLSSNSGGIRTDGRSRELEPNREELVRGHVEILDTEIPVNRLISIVIAGQFLTN